MSRDRRPTRFSLASLRLREGFDAAARDLDLTRRFAAALPPSPRLLDLGAGSGANFRYLAPRLGGPQSWLLVDSDRGLLASIESENAAWRLASREACEAAEFWQVASRRVDLAREIDRLDFATFDGITASALLDLVSADWLERLVALVVAARRPLLATLNVDGRIFWRPGAPADPTVAAAFARDQARDKGFGPALGPGAPSFLAARLAGSGYAVITRRSDWHIAGDQPPMLGAFLDSMSAVAQAVSRDSAPETADCIAAWAIRRRAEAACGELSVAVGHLDVLGLPAPRDFAGDRGMRGGGRCLS